jgi:DNA polymerase III epsilon subunit-like protein
MSTNNNLQICFVSVDIEAGGPNPGSYPILSIGACLVGRHEESFYIELQPVPMRFRPEALAISGLPVDKLAEEGTPPAEAMEQFAAWLEAVVEPEQKPVFVAYNAGFDWMFVCDYFHRYLGRNPFGHAPIDIKSLFMGIANEGWLKTGVAAASKRYGLPLQLTHHALEDAIHQATLFERMLEERKKLEETNG